MSSVNIPQANSVETLVYVVEAIRDGVDTLDQLSVEFDVRERTIHYYLELADWLGFLRDRRATQLHLTEVGQKFATSVPDRAELYEAAVLQHDLVQRALAEAPDRTYDALRAAFIDAIAELNLLAEATAIRRASALATLVEATASDEIDWDTGRVGQPTRMRRTFKATDHRVEPVDELGETVTWERPRDPVALVGEARFDALEAQIQAVLRDIGPATSGVIRDELAERFDVPLTDPSVFVVLRVGLEGGLWRADGSGTYRI